MRILFFSANIPTFEGKHSYNGAGWVGSIIKHLKDIPNVSIGYVYNGKKWEINDVNDIKYYSIPQKENSFSEKMNLFLGGNWKKVEIDSWDYYKQFFKEIVDNFQPDILHIFGSEDIFGLVSLVTSKPIVLHIQGILNPYLTAYMPPGFSWHTYNVILHPSKFYSQVMTHVQWKRQSFREVKILQTINNYIGRTEWDKRVTYIYNPNSNYYLGNEILRDEFYSCETKRNIPQKLTIISTISSPLYKGLDVVLKTAYILKELLKLDFDWKVYGNINPQFVESQIEICHFDVNVSICGVAKPKELREVILNSTVYVHPSYIDNSPNSLCEAQILGCSVIATNVGGVSSMVKDGVNGFLVPANDPYQLAFMVNNLFKDKKLNVSVGSEAQKEAWDRHNPHKIISNLLRVYETILKSQ